MQTLQFMVRMYTKGNSLVIVGIFLLISMSALAQKNHFGASVSSGIVGYNFHDLIWKLPGESKFYGRANGIGIHWNRYLNDSSKFSLETEITYFNTNQANYKLGFVRIPVTFYYSHGDKFRLKPGFSVYTSALVYQKGWEKITSFNENKNFLSIGLKPQLGFEFDFYDNPLFVGVSYFQDLTILYDQTYERQSTGERVISNQIVLNGFLLQLKYSFATKN